MNQMWWKLIIFDWKEKHSSRKNVTLKSDYFQLIHERNSPTEKALSLIALYH